jgi:hypothetical protein
MQDGWAGAMGWDAHAYDLRPLALLRAAALLVLTRVGLLTVGFQRTAAMAGGVSGPDRVRPNAAPAQVDRAQLRQTMYVVAMAAAFVPARLQCLERSIVLYYTLKRQGMPVTLRLGVRAYPFGAHAWVELAGRPVNDVPDRLKDFDPIFELR